MVQAGTLSEDEASRNSMTWSKSATRKPRGSSLSASR
jgi:hypothetical protein